MELDDLVRAVLEGESRAWTELGQRLFNDLEHFFGQSLGDADARDLAQITVMIVVRKLPEFQVEDGRPFRNWVRAIARVQLKEACRQERRRSRLIDGLAVVRRTPTTNLSSRLDRAERRELVEQELDKLDSPYRRVIQNDLDEGDIDDFCEQERIKRGSIRTRRRRAHAKLRQLVHERVKRDGDSTPQTP